MSLTTIAAVAVAITVISAPVGDHRGPPCSAFDELVVCLYILCLLSGKCTKLYGETGYLLQFFISTYLSLSFRSFTSPLLLPSISSLSLLPILSYVLSRLPSLFSLLTESSFHMLHCKVY